MNIYTHEGIIAGDGIISLLKFIVTEDGLTVKARLIKVFLWNWHIDNLTSHSVLDSDISVPKSLF